jgi:hypothetical protein
MTFIVSPDERERLNVLCELIAKETDQYKFLRLLEQLNDLLHRSKKRQQLERKNSIDLNLA